MPDGCQYIKKSFSVYNNYIKKPTCDDCGQETIIRNLTIYGALCNNCYQKRKEKTKTK